MKIFKIIEALSRIIFSVIHNFIICAETPCSYFVDGEGENLFIISIVRIARQRLLLIYYLIGKSEFKPTLEKSNFNVKKELLNNLTILS